MNKLLHQINSPADLRRLPRQDLQRLATELRAYVLDTVSKTGALLEASVMMGAACGRPTAATQAALLAYGRAVGLAFQVVDDILDVTQASETLGKTAGKDQDRNKPTFVSVLGLDAARRHAEGLRQQAHAALVDTGLGVMAATLATLADRVVERES